MLFRRHFTIMVVPDAQALLRRFHVRGAQIAGGIAGLVVLVTLALSAPLLLLWGIHLSREVAQLKSEKDQFVERAQDVEQTIADLRQRLAQSESRTESMASVMGIQVPKKSAAGQGRIVDARIKDPSQRLDALKNEADDLVGRTSLLGRSIENVEDRMGKQSESLAQRPSLMPVHGVIGGGMGWRRDPFTGLRQFHRGLDICAPIGTPVKAPADGVVLKAERDAGYGNTLTIKHGDGIVTRYGHLSAFKVQPGQKIHRGDVIALVGNTGRSTGSHLHYEILQGGQNIDPTVMILDDELF